MKPSVRAARTIMLVWTLLVFVLIGLMFIPVIPGTVEVRLPSSEGWVTSIDNQTVTVTSNISIRNGGLFPFNNFFFTVELYGDNGSTLAEFNSTKTNLQVNTWVQIPLTFVVNRSNIDNNKLRDMLFDQVTFGGLIYFNTNYLLDFRAQLGLNGSVSLGPFVHKEFDLNRTVATLEGNNATLQVPYTLNTSSVHEGRNISVSGTVSNDTQVLGTINQTIPLGQQVQDNLTVNLTRAAYDHLTTSPDHLTLNLTLSIGEFSWNYQNERDWQPPAGG